MGSNKCRFYANIESFNKEVSGSRNLITIKFPDGNTKEILVDCGLNQEEQYQECNYTLPFDVENIDYVIVTHNHADHVGMLPLLVRNGYRGEIITTLDTAILMPVTLKDSCRIQNSKSLAKPKSKEKKQKTKMKVDFKFKAKGKSKDIIKSKFKIKAKAKISHSTKVVYDETDVENTLALVKGYEFGRTIRLSNNIKLTLFENAHLPGAAIILLQISFSNHGDTVHYEDINLLFTGDYNIQNAFLDYKPLPKWVYQLPIHIIQESTYGTVYSSEIEYVFENNILKAISEGREILILALALNRYQEILLCLRNWQDEGKLSKDIPIYCDGAMGIHFTKIFHSGKLHLKEESEDFLPHNLHFINNRIQRYEMLKDNGCKIIVTTSGMGDHGPSQMYIPIFLKKRNALIHFTSYLAEGTLGRTLLDTSEDEEIVIMGAKIKKQAEVKFTLEFSSHAKKDELLQFLKDFENIKTVLINHGSFEAKDVYSTAVLNEINTKNVCILGIGYYFRLNGYGLISSRSTHSIYS